MSVYTSSRQATKDEMAREIDRCHGVIVDLEARVQKLEADFRFADLGERLRLLYEIRAAIGWTDKHGLSLLPDECRRLKAAASRNAGIWPGKDYDHSQPGGFDGPTGAD